MPHRPCQLVVSEHRAVVGELQRGVRARGRVVPFVEQLPRGAKPLRDAGVGRFIDQTVAALDFVQLPGDVTGGGDDLAPRHRVRFVGQDLLPAGVEKRALMIVERVAEAAVAECRLLEGTAPRIEERPEGRDEWAYTSRRAAANQALAVAQIAAKRISHINARSQPAYRALPGLIVET